MRPADLSPIAAKRAQSAGRRWARPGWEADDPDYTVEREMRVLGLLVPMPVPAPAVVAADPAGVQCDVPAILLTRLPGHPPRPADTAAVGFCRQLAETLAAIHDAGLRPKPSWRPIACTSTGPGRYRRAG